MLGLIGKKIGMTQLFADDGTAVPVTAIEAGPCPIIQVKTEERDGYRAVQLGFGRKKPKRARKPGLGHSGKAGLDYIPTVVREFRLGEGDVLADDPHTPLPVAEATPEPESAEAAEGGNHPPTAPPPLQMPVIGCMVFYRSPVAGQNQPPPGQTLAA